jgi:hypothetical protein
VFDVFLGLTLLRALAASARRRFVPGLVAVAAGAVLWVGLVASGWLGRGADGSGTSGAWVLVFLGPSAAIAPTPSVRWSGAMAAHPIGSKALVLAALALPFVLAWTRASALSPLSDQASALKKLGLVYLVPVVLLLVQLVVLVIADVAGDRL